MATRVWHPGAERRRLEDAGPYTGGGRKFCVHTTEGPTLEGAFTTLDANRSAPHFILEVKDGRRKLVQCVPISLAARSLAHPSGPDTNKANCIQVEVVGWTDKDLAEAAGHPELWVGNWEPAVDRFLHRLMQWTNRHFDVPMTASFAFPGKPGFRRLGGQEFFDAVGLVGHCHAPGNDHTDPGPLKVRRVLFGPAAAGAHTHPLPA